MSNEQSDKQYTAADIEAAIEQEKKRLSKYHRDYDRDKSKQHEDMVNALLKVNKLLHDENVELRRDRDNFWKWATTIKCCKNIATDGPYISCSNVAAYRYKNEYGDIVTYCEEHAPRKSKDE